MWAVVVLAIVGVANSASVERRALTPMTGYQLDSKAFSWVVCIFEEIKLINMKFSTYYCDIYLYIYLCARYSARPSVSVSFVNVHTCLDMIFIHQQYILDYYDFSTKIMLLTLTRTILVSNGRFF